jgi:phosphatidylglycerol:prolipoprotein diacylglycerol transferase
MLPVLFTLPLPWGPQPIYAYGVMLGLSLIAGYQLVEQLAIKRTSLSAQVAGGAAVVAALSGLLGARVLYVVENREALRSAGTSFFDITAGGVSAFGGFAGGLLGAAVYLRWRRASLADFADVAAPALALGIVLTRIGCYLYGCDFGSVLSKDAPGFLQSLGTFPRWQHDDLGIHGSPALLHHIDRYGLSRDAIASLPVHPTQLYEALAGLLLLGWSALLWRNRRYAGQVVLPVAMGYAAFRYGIEYLRDDPEVSSLAGFTSGQLFSLALFAAAAIALSVARTRARRA